MDFDALKALLKRENLGVAVVVGCVSVLMSAPAHASKR